MNLSRFFIDRPIFAGVLSVLLFLGGMIALRFLPVSEYPEVVPPSVVVTANYPGASPKVIAETVAMPLEEGRPRVPQLLSKPRRTLDVGEQEGDGPGRSLGHAPSVVRRSADGKHLRSVGLLGYPAGRCSAHSSALSPIAPS